MMDSDFVVPADAGIVDQRIAPGKAGFELDIDMRAWLESGHKTTADPFENVRIDPFRFPADRPNESLHHTLLKARCVRWSTRAAIDRRPAWTFMRLVT